MKNLLTIAGSDCSGGAGIQADLKTFAAHGTYGMSVIVSVVAENTSRVISIRDMDVGIIRDQIDAVFEDIQIDGVKVGMLSSVEIIRTVAQKLRQHHLPRPVIDPVMVAKGGSPLMRDSALDTLIHEMIPLAFLLTPNIPEAETITGKTITSVQDMREAARSIREMGAQNVLIKGGHLNGAAEDILFDGNKFTHYRSPRIATKNTHGTGCTFSSAIAANLANDMDIAEAVRAGKEYITMAIEHALPMGKGHGPVNHFYQLLRKGGAHNEI
jgi:hydroxymethylpyrimidine/phosphomethylpyrimidine kinase